jgi:hypothetical protein
VAELLRWILAARDRAELASMGAVPALLQAGRAFLEAFVSSSGLAGLVRGRLAPETIAGAAATLAVPALFRLIAWNVRAGRSRPDLIGKGMALGVALTAIFIGWFQPSNVEYWVYAVPFVWMGAWAGSDSPRVPYATTAGAFRRWGLVIAAAGIALVGLVNLTARVLPAMNEQKADYAEALAFARERFRAGDVLLWGRDDDLLIATIALPFFAGVEVVTLPGAGTGDGNSGGVRGRLETAEGRTTASATYCTESGAEVLARMRTSWGRGGPIGELGGRLIYRVESSHP